MTLGWWSPSRQRRRTPRGNARSNRTRGDLRREPPRWQDSAIFAAPRPSATTDRGRRVSAARTGAVRTSSKQASADSGSALFIRRVLISIFPILSKYGPRAQGSPLPRPSPEDPRTRLPRRIRAANRAYLRGPVSFSGRKLPGSPPHHRERPSRSRTFVSFSTPSRARRKVFSGRPPGSGRRRRSAPGDRSRGRRSSAPSDSRADPGSLAGSRCRSGTCHGGST